MDNKNWFDPAWHYRSSLTIHPDKIPLEGNEPLIDFPLRVLPPEGMLVGKVHPQGYDILFTADDGITKLSHEIQYWNPSNGRLIAWVKIPSISPHYETTIYLYYGNPDSPNQENKADVWASVLSVK